MALIKFGGGVAGASGKIAGNVFARNRSGNYMRNWNKPVNNQSPSQMNVRQNLADSNAAWALLSPAEVNSWRAYAAVSTRFNRLGEAYVPTAKQLYTEQFLNMMTVGLAPLVMAPSIVYVSPAITSFVINVAESAGGEMASLTCSAAGVTIPSGGDPSDSKLIIYGTPNLPYQRSFVKNLYRVLTVEDATITGQEISGAYNAIFGMSSAVDAWLYLSARVVDAGTGLASPLKNTRAQVVAP